MLKNLTQFYYPTTVAGACSYLNDKDIKSAIIAGGTSEALRNDSSIEALIDISKIEGLSYIEQNSDFIKLGATVPMQNVYKSAKISGVSGDLLKFTAGKIGSTLLRNSITVAGNLVGLYPWSDFPVALLALDAEIVAANAKSERTLAVSEAVAAPSGKFLQHAEMVTAINVPVYGKGTGVSFAKMSKTSNDYALISVASRLTLSEGKIKEARIAVNAITALPCRCSDAEQMLVGKAPSVELFSQAAAKAVAALKLRKDYRASEEYRKEVCEVMVRRSLEESLEKAKK